MCRTLHQDRKIKVIEVLLIGSFHDPYERKCTFLSTGLAHGAAQLLPDIFPRQLLLPLMLVIFCIYKSVKAGPQEQ